MREILFRGKRTDNGEWFYGYYTNARYYLDKKEMHIIFEQDVEVYPHSEFAGGEEVIPETVGQYTGLTDKGGRKIFEGDIVRCYYSDISPFTDEIEPYEKEVLIDDIRRSQVIGWIDCADELEIIGNIYDNPELMEVKQND